VAVGTGIAIHCPTAAMHRKPLDVMTLLDALVCIWLIVSAFLLPYSRAETTNVLVVGVIGLVAAALAFTVDKRARMVNFPLAIWLMLSIWLFPAQGTQVGFNIALVAFLLFTLSMPVRRSEAVE
jgi:hypothetical protein